VAVESSLAHTLRRLGCRSDNPLEAAASSQNEAEESEATEDERKKRQGRERREWEDREVA